MPERPLLLFPMPASANRDKKDGRPPKILYPEYERQNSRLSPMFDSLANDFNSRKLEIIASSDEIDPEQVIVLETIGNVEDFIKTINRIEGLEWLGEIELEDILPDHDFHCEENASKNLSGRLYLLMTNQLGLNNMISLWNHYKNNRNFKFPTGLTKFRDVFKHLKNIRRWDITDRYLETGVIESWKKDLEYDGDRNIKFELELWFTKNEIKRNIIEQTISRIIQQSGGHILKKTAIPEISYHAILSELPANEISNIINNTSIELIKCDNIMFIRPVGQMIAIDHNNSENEDIQPESDLNFQEQELPSEAPLIALLDGLPLSNHILLKNRIIIDDPDNFEDSYSASDRKHGTSMSSLIIHGDLNHGAKPIKHKIYVRPVMKPMPWYNGNSIECVPSDHLTIDLFHRSIKRIFEGENGSSPIAPSIKIINISVGDTSRQYSQIISPLSRLIDWLSYKYNILFIISAGNHPDSLPLDILERDFDLLNDSEKEKMIVKSIFKNRRNRRLLSPAESINSITVGAVNIDSAQISNLGNRFNPYRRTLPSPISAIGSGHRRSIKPDIIVMGGLQLFRKSIIRNSNSNLIIEPTKSPSNYSPGNKSAFPSDQPGNLSDTKYSCGTSNSTALTTRFASICSGTLNQIFEDQLLTSDLSKYETSLIKAMVIHGSSWGSIKEDICDILNQVNSSDIDRFARNWMGYGIPNPDRILECTPQRATMIGFGQLLDGQANLFKLPLPPSLASQSTWRRLTVTLAWISPISPSTQKYRDAGLWFDVYGVDIASQRKESSSGRNGWQAVRRGTVQHEIFEGDTAQPFVDGEYIEIKVNCSKDANAINEPINFGLLVTLEVKDNITIDIYNEIKIKIRTAIEIQSR